MKLHLVCQHLSQVHESALHLWLRAAKLMWSLEPTVSSKTKYLFFLPAGTIVLEPKYMELTHKTGILERTGREPADWLPATCYALLDSNKALESSGFDRWALQPLKGCCRGSHGKWRQEQQPDLIDLRGQTCVPSTCQGFEDKGSWYSENSRIWAWGIPPTPLEPSKLPACTSNFS